MSLKHVQTGLLKYSGLLILILISLATLSYFFLDQTLSLTFNDEDLMAYRKTARALTNIGLGEYSFALAICSFILFFWAARKAQVRTFMNHSWSWLKAWSLNYFLALIFSGTLGHLIKILIGRQRPHVSDTFDAHIFSPISFDSYNQSLPSGHAQVLFCSATMLAILWPRRAGLIYLLAAILTFSRVMVHAHFLSDIMAGGLVGHLGALWSIGLVQKYAKPEYSLTSRPS